MFVFRLPARVRCLSAVCRRKRLTRSDDAGAKQVVHVHGAEQHSGIVHDQ
jgi:hypothetical protein